MIDKQSKYNAQGFIEALIAIIITGIASIVFMTIAAKTIGQVVKNEYVDQLTQEAVQGSAMLRYVVEEWNFNRRDVIESEFLSPSSPDSGFSSSMGYCYGLDGDVQNISITEQMVCIYDNGINPSDCASASNWDKVKISNTKIPSQNDNLFRIACVDPDQSDTNTNILFVRIYTGFRGCSTINETMRNFGEAGSSCNLYEHINVFKLEPVQ